MLQVLHRLSLLYSVYNLNPRFLVACDLDRWDANPGIGAVDGVYARRQP